MSFPPQHGWSVPPPLPPPSPPTRPIRTGKVFAGIGLAFLAQVVAIGIGIGLAFLGGLMAVYVEIFLQVVVFIACLVVGILWINSRDRGIGLGVLIGWAVSVLVFPVAGIGVCIAILNNNQGTF